LNRRTLTTWLKRIIVTVAIVTIVMVLVAIYLLRGSPDWYARATLTAEERALLASEAEGTLLRAREFAASARAAEARSATNPAMSAIPTEPMNVDFSQEAINSIVEKWGGIRNWRAGYEQYVRDPVLIFRKDRIILAGLVKDFGAVVSLHFAPKVTEKGELRLDLVKVLGGNLPMPESMYANYRDKITGGLQRKLAVWQRGAEIEPDGTANEAATSASLARLMLAALNSQPTDAVLFLPLGTGDDGSVPMKVTEILVADQKLSMTIRPLSSDERKGVAQRLKQPPTATVAVTNP